MSRAVLAAILALACLAALPAAGPAGAQQEELKDIERALREDRGRAQDLKLQADKLAREIQALRVESISVARQAQDQESRMSEIEDRLAGLERQERGKVEGLAERRHQLGRTLAALQRIALQPPDAVLFAPASPLDTVRSGMLLRAAVPALEARAALLREELRGLAALRARIAAERGDLAKTTLALAEDRGRLETLIARKSQTRAAAAAGQQAAQARAARLAARAQDLRELIEKVEREAAAREQAAREQAAAAAPETATESPADAPAEVPADTPAQTQIALAQPPNIRPFPSSGQSLVLPARGQVKTHFGQVQGDGAAARGIVIGARKGAQVVAPYDGKVVYAGIFRSYGQILIIEHGGRYHTLLAGLERIDAVVGQWLLAGEPVGVLGSPRAGEPELYLELRHAGQPINPVPWLATTGHKVRG